MSLTTRLQRLPLPAEPDLAAEVAAAYPAEAGALVAGMAGSSSHLRALLERERAWFAEALEREPEEAFEELLAIDPEAEDVGRLLRRAKRRAALLIAAADLGGVWSLDEVTRALTRLADRATAAALDEQVRRQAARGRLPGAPQDAGEAGLVALAMGKMGAFELNYSSDIDLILLFDEARVAETYEESRAAFQRVVRDAMKLLSEQTAEGYVFRTDLRLRPNPSVTPVCVPMEAAERYYEAEGRTWERAAFIKARPCAGDLSAGAAFLKTLTPFVWRRHLDFAAIRDAHDIRLSIREHKGLGGPLSVPGHDIKLGRGGIREIEFFAQTRQLIAGGRDPDLRSPRTEDALAALARKGWIPEDIARTLTAAYRAHRETEHRIQMLRDAQTHRIPASREALDQLARLSGQPDTEAWMAEQKARLEEVDAIIERFFEPAAPARPVHAVPAPIREAMENWRGLPALRSRRAIEIFKRLQPEIGARIAETQDPEATLRALDAFVRALPAGVQLFSLFEANPHILDLVLEICAIAPGLAAYLSRNTGVLDAVISGDFFSPLPDAAGFAASLEAVLAEAPDYEEALNAARRWQKEQHFRIGVLLLRRLASLEEVERGYSDLAEATLRCILPRVEREVARRYGRFEAQSVAILAMGKLGSRQMTARSDLDLIVVYDAKGEMASGRQGFAPPQYFARLTQTLITALSSAMSEGELYEVDMRLRPSGRQGPVAVSLAGFEDYQRTQAWTWEHLALTRARVVAGDPELGRRLEDLRAEVLGLPRDRGKVLEDVADMRRRLREAKGAQANEWDVKDRTGGLLELELAAQALALLGGSTAQDPRAQLGEAAAAGLLDADTAQALVEDHRFLCAVQQAQRLLVEGRFDPERLGRDGMAFVCAFAGAEDAEELRARIDAACARGSAVFEDVLAA